MRCPLLAKLLIILVFSSISLTWMCSKKSAEPSPTPPSPLKLAKVVMGYYPSWEKGTFDHTKIKYEYLTHIAQAFAKPDSAGNLIVPAETYYPELISEAHRQDVKVILSLGGWENCEGFPGMAATPQTRDRFIGQVVDFLIKYRYDGIDIDWEFVSNPVERLDFVSFIKELSARLKAQNPPLLLTMAGPSADYYGKWINFEELAGSFDYISCMTYDYHGPWTDHSGHNSPMYSCANDPDGSFNDSYFYYISRGVPKEKLLLGLPFYGRSFDCSGLYQKYSTSLYYSYQEAAPLLDSGWTYLWDDCAQVPYLRKPDQTMIISYDDERSIGLKCQYILDKNAAGVIIWEITEDYYNGSSVLLKKVGETFKKK